MHSFEDFQAIVTPDEPLAPHTWFRLGGPGRLPRPPAGRRRGRRPDPPLPRRPTSRSGSSAAARTSSSATRGSPAWSSTWRARRSPTSRSTGGKVEAGSAVPLTALISQTARAGPGRPGGPDRHPRDRRRGAPGELGRPAGGDRQLRPPGDRGRRLGRGHGPRARRPPVRISIVRPRRADHPLGRVRARARRPRGRRPADEADLDHQEGEPALRPPVVGLHLQEPDARDLGRHPDRAGRPEGPARRRRRGLRPPRQLHRRPARSPVRPTSSS